MSIELETQMRTVENIPGVVYDENKTTQNFAEDHNSLVEAITELAEKSANNTTIENVLAPHIADDNNPHFVTKAQVGLGNVDNTSDIEKPISNSVNNALNSKADLVNGVVPASQLPPISGGISFISSTLGAYGSAVAVPSDAKFVIAIHTYGGYYFPPITLFKNGFNTHQVKNPNSSQVGYMTWNANNTLSLSGTYGGSFDLYFYK